MVLSDSKWVKNIKCVKGISNSEKVNPALIFDKYFLWGITQDDTPTYSPNRKDNCKVQHLERLIKYKIPLEVTSYSYLKNRKNSLPGIMSFSLNTKTRVIVNHGGESILKNSILIHPYYGFPIISGSAIKGVTRHYCDEFEIIDEGFKKRIFGNSPAEKESQRGNILFADAWPKNVNRDSLSDFFELDVFTPHYQDYYQKNKFPRDDQNPVPVHFIAVKKGIEFEFAIAPLVGYGKENVQEDLDLVRGLITNALKTFGIGAKTDSSYGYFEQRVC
ncbi:type III-B CRISPR module RAMP protein Cmr6 [Methanosarcina sp. Ant1]|nr:type III-B CRISPR module RAMP protein Cmr6 [Methanosarcina sp. Ant1]